MADLTQPAPRQGTADSDICALLAEWLTGWFDGTSKPFATGGTARTWPALTADRMAFGQAAVPSPLAGLFLTVLLLDRGKPKVWPVAPPEGAPAEQRASTHEKLYSVQIFVRASVGSSHARWRTNEAALAEVGGLLEGLLASHAAREALEAKRVFVEHEQKLPVPQEGQTGICLVACELRARVSVS